MKRLWVEMDQYRNPKKKVTQTLVEGDCVIFLQDITLSSIKFVFESLKKKRGLLLNVVFPIVRAEGSRRAYLQLSLQRHYKQSEITDIHSSI